MAEQSFWDKVKRYFDIAAVKTSETIEVSKRYVNKAQVQGKLNSLYERYGKAQYLTQTGEANEHDLIVQLAAEIAETRAQLAQAEQKYLAAKPIKCSCGKKNTPDSTFCIQCGEKLNVEKK